MDRDLREKYLETATMAERLVLGDRNRYNQAGISIPDYARFGPGRPTFIPLIWVKVLRYRALFYGTSTEEELLETLVDLQNYVRFEIMLRRGDVA